MKKSFYHILLLGALTLGITSSCDDYLEVDHYDILPDDFMYQNEANIKSGLMVFTILSIPIRAVTTVAMIRHGDSSLMYLLPDTARWIARHPAGMPNGNAMRYWPIKVRWIRLGV